MRSSMENQFKAPGEKKVLVVDDNMANSFALAAMTERLGFQVKQAGSGREAINDVCQEEYDIILMDHLMPEMNGIEAIKQILFVSKGKKRPVIIGVSATVDQAVKDEFLQAGADDVLEKPVRMQKLEELVQSLGVNSEETDSEEIDEDEEIVEIAVDEILDSVSGLNYPKGIEFMAGSVENYMKVLMVSVKNISENYHAIELAYENKRMDNVALYFHSLKGIFLNIGAESLAEISRQLEMAAKAEEFETVMDRIPDFVKQVQEFDEQLSDACDDYQQKIYAVHATEQISTDDFAGKLAELRAHIEDFEYIEITDLLEQMLPCVSGKQEEYLKKINEAIQNFEYDMAMELLDDLQQEL